MASARVIDNIEVERGGEVDRGPVTKYYRVDQLIPSPDPPMYKLLKKEPGVWASVQISTGILSFGIGVAFAVAFPINSMFLTLFRVPLFTGLLFLIAGSLSTLLYKNQSLLQVCFLSNVGCLVVAALGAVLLCSDFTTSHPGTPAYQVEILVLCVTLLDIFVSAVLIYLTHSEKRRQAKK